MDYTLLDLENISEVDMHNYITRLQLDLAGMTRYYLLLDVDLADLETVEEWESE